MTIKRIDTVMVRQGMTDPEWRFSRGAIPHVDGFAVLIVNGDGVGGHGYCRSLPPWTPPIAAIKESFDHATADLIGLDEADIAGAMATVDRRLTGSPAIRAGIECALYDLRARTLNLPLHALFGGRRHNSFPNARIIPLKPPAEMAAVAAELVGQGYRYLKVKASGEPALDLARLRAVRDAVGGGAELMVDANEAYGVKEAIATIGRMTEYGVRLVEQPVPARNPADLVEVARQSPIPVEADESAPDLPTVIRLVAARSVQSINLRVFNLGGLENALTAARLCVAGGVGFRFGAIFCASVMHAHTIHLAAGLPAPAFPHEFSETRLLKDDPFVGLEFTGGTVRVPDGVGCGVTLRR